LPDANMNEEQRPSMHIAYVDLIEPLKEGKGEQTNNCSHITWFGQEIIIRLNTFNFSK